MDARVLCVTSHQSTPLYRTSYNKNKIDLFLIFIQLVVQRGCYRCNCLPFRICDFHSFGSFFFGGKRELKTRTTAIETKKANRFNIDSNYLSEFICKYAFWYIYANADRTIEAITQQ